MPREGAHGYRSAAEEQPIRSRHSPCGNGNLHYIPPSGAAPDIMADARAGGGRGGIFGFAVVLPPAALSGLVVRRAARRLSASEPCGDLALVHEGVEATLGQRLAGRAHALAQGGTLDGIAGAEPVVVAPAGVLDALRCCAAASPAGMPRTAPRTARPPAAATADLSARVDFDMDELPLVSFQVPARILRA